MSTYDDFVDDMRREKARLEQVMPSNHVYSQKDLREIGMAPTPEAGGFHARDTSWLMGLREQIKSYEPVPLDLEERVAMQVIADRLDIRLADVIRTRRIGELLDLDKSDYKIMCVNDDINHGRESRLVEMSGVILEVEDVRATVWTGQCPGCLMIYWEMTIEESESL